MNFETNCKNCGAPLSYHEYDTIVKCEYCGTEYRRDRFGRFKENYVTIRIGGRDRRFYISRTEIEPCYLETTTLVDGTRTFINGRDTIILELISVD